MKVPWVHRSGVLWFLWVLWLAAAQDTPPPGAAPTPAASHLTTVTASSGSPGDSHSVEPAASPAPSQASRAGTPAAGSSPAAVDLSNTSASRAAASGASAAPAQVEPPLPDVTLTTAVPRADGPVPLEVTAPAGPPRPSKGLSYGTAGSLAEPSLTPTSFGGLFTTTTPASTSAINATAPSSPVAVSTSTVASPPTVTTRTNTSSSVVTSAAPVVAPLQTLTTMISTSSFSVTVPTTLPIMTTETPTATTSVTLSVTAPVISSPSTAAAAPVTAPTVVPAPAPAIPSRPKRLHLPSELTVEPELHRLLLSTLAPDGYSELSGHPAALRQHRLGGASAGTGWPVKLNAVVEGDLVLGGLMMVHEREDSVVCGPIMPQGGIQALEAMLYTLDVINDDKEFLPGVVLGAHILDDCDKDTYGLEMAVDFIKGTMGDVEEAVTKNVDSSCVSGGFQCPICSKVLNTQQGLATHIHVHDDARPPRKKRGEKKKNIGRKGKHVKKSDNTMDVMPSTSAACSSSVWSSMAVVAPNDPDEDFTSDTDNDVSLNIQDDNSNSEQPKQVEECESQAKTEGLSETDDVADKPDVKILHIVPSTELDYFYDSIVTESMSVDESLINPEENDTSDTDIEEDDNATMGLMEEDPFVIDDDIVKGMALLKMAASEEGLVTLYHYLMLSLSEEWKIDLMRNNCLRLIYVSPYDNASVTRTITWKNGEISIFIHNKPLPRTSYLWDAVKMIESVDNIGAVADHLFRVAKLVQHSTLCQGIRIYDKYWKEAEMDGQGCVETIYEESHCFRTSNCSLVVLENSTCHACQRTKSNFKSKQQRQKQSKSQKFTKNINLSKQELIEKASELQQKSRTQEKKIAKLKLRIQRYVSRNSVNINQDLSDDLARIFQKHHDSMTEVQKLFWSEQLQALSKRKKARTIRWNPFVIKIALHLQGISRSSYKYLSNFITLPSERTLYDYTHVVEAKEGIQELVVADLKKQLEDTPREEYEQFFNLLFDEVHIKSDIVVSKRTGEVIGYTNLSEVEKQLAEVEASISKTDFLNKPATKVLMFMAQGVCTSITGIVGAYSTDTLTAGQLYSRAWNVIYKLESSGLKVLSLICDGAAMNKKFFKMHRAWDEDKDFVYATENLASCDERRPIFFVIDPPHVLKTVRNCLANSHGHKKSRQMFKNNEEISWQPIELLFETTKSEKFRSHKLTRAHIQLTSYGCMKVVYATQVMSDSVVNAIQNFKADPRFQKYELDELCKFLKLMNDAFDCWNSYSDEKGKRNKWNPLLAPYTDVNDPRFVFLKGEFLSFFDDWKKDVMNRPGKFSKQSRERMFISFQSYESLYISVYGFCGALQFMLGEKNAPSIDGRKFNQDKLEQHFGILRMSCGGNDNPTLSRTLQHIQDKHIQGSAARPTKKGNTEASEEWLPDERAIPKKKRRAE